MMIDSILTLGVSSILGLAGGTCIFVVCVWFPVWLRDRYVRRNKTKPPTQPKA